MYTVVEIFLRATGLDSPSLERGPSVLHMRLHDIICAVKLRHETRLAGRVAAGVCSIETV